MNIYYIGADAHSNNTEPEIKKNKIVARYSVPTTIPAIANVLDSLQEKNTGTSRKARWPAGCNAISIRSWIGLSKRTRDVIN